MNKTEKTIVNLKNIEFCIFVPILSKEMPKRAFKTPFGTDIVEK